MYYYIKNYFKDPFNWIFLLAVIALFVLANIKCSKDESADEPVDKPADGTNDGICVIYGILTYGPQFGQLQGTKIKGDVMTCYIDGDLPMQCTSDINGKWSFLILKGKKYSLSTLYCSHNYNIIKTDYRILNSDTDWGNTFVAVMSMKKVEIDYD